MAAIHAEPRRAPVGLLLALLEALHQGLGVEPGALDRLFLLASQRRHRGGLLGLYARAAALVTNDTGPLQLALTQGLPRR